MLETREILKRAKEAKSSISCADTETRNAALSYMADALLSHQSEILSANAEDLSSAPESISEVMKDRLRLNEQRIRGMADGIREVMNLPDPVGEVLDTVSRPNGLLIQKVRVPMGVIAIIFESRPNVTSDAAALAVKAGSACILRGGKEAHRSCMAITEALKEGLRRAGLPEDALFLVEDVSRDSARELMLARGFVDLLIPRGGKGLIRTVVDEARVPVLETGTGICHIYVDESADLKMALRILENAKCQRPSVCNAAEVCLVNESIAAEFLPMFRKTMVEDRKERGEVPVELILCEQAQKLIPGTPAGADSFDTEFLDYKMAVKVVPDVDAAISHIALHSTGHSDCIITESEDAKRKFQTGVDSAAVYVNASTRFTDGGEFGLGCEMGISTQKLHARGPMGLRELCTYKYLVTGQGQTRK